MAGPHSHQTRPSPYARILQKLKNRSQTIPFLDLPQEVRDQIYMHLFSEVIWIIIGSRTSKTPKQYRRELYHMYTQKVVGSAKIPLAILRTCHRVHNEAAAFLYGTVTLQMRMLTLDWFLGEIGSVYGYYASTIKHLHLCGMYSDGISTENSRKLAALCMQMKHLETLSITISVGNAKLILETSRLATTLWKFLVKSLIDHHRSLKKILRCSSSPLALNTQFGVTLISERYQLRDGETTSDAMIFPAEPCHHLPCTIPRHFRDPFLKDPNGIFI